MASTWPEKKNKKKTQMPVGLALRDTSLVTKHQLEIIKKKERKKDKIITKMFCCELSIQRNVVVRLYMYDQKRLQFALDDLARFQISGGNS